MKLREADAGDSATVSRSFIIIISLKVYFLLLYATSLNNLLCHLHHGNSNGITDHDECKKDDGRIAQGIYVVTEEIIAQPGVNGEA